MLILIEWTSSTNDNRNDDAELSCDDEILGESFLRGVDHVDDDRLIEIVFSALCNDFSVFGVKIWLN